MNTPIPLKDLCERATKGPWQAERQMVFCGRMGGLVAKTYDNCETGSDKNGYTNAQLIARCSPEVMARLYEALADAQHIIHSCLDASNTRRNEDEIKHIANALALLDGKENSA